VRVRVCERMLPHAYGKGDDECICMYGRMSYTHSHSHSHTHTHTHSLFTHTLTHSRSQVVHRVFPVARGLYEDKVGSVWCASSLLIKWKMIMSTDDLLKLAAAATVQEHVHVWMCLSGCVYGCKHGCDVSVCVYVIIN
jgi:hypothetical protein